MESCPLIAFGETTPELSSQSQNKIQPQNISGVGTSTPKCSGVWGSTARPWMNPNLILYYIINCPIPSKIAIENSFIHSFINHQKKIKDDFIHKQAFL